MTTIEQPLGICEYAPNAQITSDSDIIVLRNNLRTIFIFSEFKLAYLQSKGFLQIFLHLLPLVFKKYLPSSTKLSNMSILKTDNIMKKYGNRTVVQNVSIQVEQGEIVGLLGPNGAGKTTSFYMVMGLINPDGGNIFLDDRNITSEPVYKRARYGIGYLAQEASVFRTLSVENNIMSILEMTTLNKKEQKEKLEELLTDFNLLHIRKNLGIQLSGGERRRTEIARALASNPKFILLDEPFAGVDPIAVEEIQRIVRELKNRNIGILITDHNVDETLSITDKAYILFEGTIFKAGTAQELADDPEVRRVYLGTNFELKKDFSKQKKEE